MTTLRDRVPSSEPAAGEPRRSAVGRPPGPIAVAVSLLVTGWITLDVLLGGWWVTVDDRVSETMRRIGVRDAFWSKAGVYVFTQLGARGTILVLFVPFVLVLAWRRQSWQPLLRFVVALGLLTVTIYALKYGVGRSAPPVHEIRTDGSSYPSGHAPNSVLMWGLAGWLAVEYDLPARIQTVIGKLRYAAPLLTCAAMLLLDYHWLSDLVAGVAIGVILLRVLHLIFQSRLRGWGDGKRVDAQGRDRNHDRGVAASGAAGITS